MENKKYFSIYRGIIIQNNDKNHAGMVKVWVPSVSPTSYEGIINIPKKRRIKLLGANTFSSLTADLLEDFKIILPWASLGMSITNEGCSGRYNARSDTYVSGDGQNILDNDLNNINFTNQNSESNLPMSEKPGAIFETQEYGLSDAFDGSNIQINKINSNSKNYKPSVYSNKSKGEFGIPNVGSHVVVQFFEGDPHFPFVTHLVYGKEDYESIYDVTDYPGSYENNTTIPGEYNHNIDKYRSKYVLNQKAGSLEIINTDLNEKVKLSHYSGSFKEFNNQTNIELAVNNDQKLVQGDSFNTIKCNNNTFIGRDNDKIVLGDDYEKIGNLNWKAVELWKSQMAEISDYKQLFDIQRCEADNIIKEGDSIAFKFNSTMQQKVGTPAISPEYLQNITLYPVSIDLNNEINTLISSIQDEASSAINEIITELSTMAPSAVENLIHDTITGLTSAINIPTVELPCLSLFPSYSLPGVSQFSESSDNGVWNIDPLKNQIQKLYQEKAIQLAEIEKQMGLGGSKIIQITKDKVETIGMAVNDYGSIRIDSKGKSVHSELKIHKNGLAMHNKASPMIEYVNVQPLPGGSYNLTVCDRFNILVGAGGLNIKTYGSCNISGTITNIAGEQINIGSSNEININSAKRMEICADNLTLKQKDNKQILVDSTLGVSNNIIIGGSQYINGELYVNHITAPMEMQETETDSATYAGVPINSDNTPRFTKIGHAIGPNGEEYPVLITEFNCIQVNPHRHPFVNVPLTLKNNSTEVRNDASKITDNPDVPGAPAPITFGPKI